MVKTFAGASLIAVMATGATASTIGFDLTLEGNWNTPFITVASTGDSHFTLDSFTISIGDTTKNFDWARRKKIDKPLVAPEGGTVSAVPDIADNAGTNFDVLEFWFTGFNSGDSFRFMTDIDDDADSEAWLYFSEVLFNNGTADNSVATATFSNGQTLSFEIPDSGGARPFYEERPYIFSITADATPVPLPAGGALLLAGLAAFGLARRKA